MDNDVLLRMKDVSMCLLASSKHDLRLGRLELQKIVYLADSMGVYLFVLLNRKNHKTYFYGPYDKYIQIAIDALTIRELIDLHPVRLHGGKVSYKYSITNKGLDWVNKISSHLSTFKFRENIISSLIYSLVNRNLMSNVKGLVYAEPMFVGAKEHGYHYDLNFIVPNSGHSYLALIEHYLKARKEISIEFTVDMYIDYLDVRSGMLSSGVTSGDEDDFVTI